MIRSKTWRPYLRTGEATLAVLSVSWGLNACGGNPIAPTRATPTPEKTTPAPTELVPRKPSALVFIARLKEPRRSIDRLAEWCSLPAEFDDALSQLGKEVPKLVRFDHSIDLAVSLVDEQYVTPEPSPPDEYESPSEFGGDGGVTNTDVATPEPSLVYAIISVGVDNPDGLVRAIETEGKSVQDKGNHEYLVELDDDLKCLLGPSRGLSAHRLTCATTSEALEALASYAHTGLVMHPFPDKAFYGELYFKPLRARYGKDVHEMKAELPTFLQDAKIGNQRFDRALEVAAAAVSDEVLAWVDDLDTWSFSASYPTDREVLLGESTIRFERNTGYVSSLLNRSATESQATPQLFWDLPQEVDTASFNTRIKVTESERKISANLTELLAGGVEYLGVATGVVDVWVKSFRELLESGGTLVMASGGSPEPPKPVRAKSPRSILDSFGYYLVGVEGDTGALARSWRSTVAAFNDHRLRATLGKKLEENLSKLPMIRSRTIAKSKTIPAIELFTLSFPIPKSELPKAFTKGTLSIYVAMASVGERTWFGFAFAEAEATNIVRKLVTGTTYPTLGQREGLTSLHNRNLAQGSFFTLKSYAKMLGALPLGEDETPLGAELVRAMPHGGRTPGVFMLSTSADGPSLTASWELPREFFDDGSALTVALISAFGSGMSHW